MHQDLDPMPLAPTAIQPEKPLLQPVTNPKRRQTERQLSVAMPMPVAMREQQLATTRLHLVSEQQLLELAPTALEISR